MFPKNEDDKTRDWGKLVDSHISLYKYLKEVGKIGIAQARSGHISLEVQSKLLDALTKADKTLLNLKKILKPCLTDVDTKDLNVLDTTETRQLVQEITRLKHENVYLERQLADRSESNTRALKHELSLSQQVFERRRDILLQEKRDSEQRVLKLENHCQELMEEIQKLKDGGGSYPINRYTKKQLQLEHTLKTQNDLIEDLKQQLANEAKEREILRNLNNSLEIELQKRNVEKQPRDLGEKLIPTATVFEDDYFHRGTLRMDDLEFQNGKLEQQSQKDTNTWETQRKSSISEENTLLQETSEKKDDVHKVDDKVDFEKEQQRLQDLMYETLKLERELLEHQDKTKYVIPHHQEKNYAR